MKKIVIQKDGGTALRFRTVGLTAEGQQEIVVSAEDDLGEEVEQFLTFIIDYLQTGSKLQPNETMAYGFWLTKFHQNDRGELEVWEYNSEATDFLPGVTQTLRYWKDQHEVCMLHGAAFDPPRPDKLSVISRGVLEGCAVQGVRYPSPGHMSGWWITSDLFDGDRRSLIHEHTYHVTAARPDLARYLALPYGFRFDLSAGEDVWMDKEVLSSS